MKSQPR